MEELEGPVECECSTGQVLRGMLIGTAGGRSPLVMLDRGLPAITQEFAE